MSKLRIAIAGARGRMGQITFLEVLSDENAVCIAMLVKPSSPDVGGLVLLPDTAIGSGLYYSADHARAFRAADVVIDFTTPAASAENAALAAKTGTAIVIGTTGFTEKQLDIIKAAGEKAPVLLSYNMSFGVAALAKAVTLFSKALGDDFYVEITDIHHKGKKDAPSGTALMLGAATGRSGGDIKYRSVREGAVIGEHHVLFSGPAEEIEIIHRARDRILYAKGALLAARWLARQKPGFYTLNDVLKG